MDRNIEDRIIEILSTISGFYTYDDKMGHEYIKLIGEAVELIRRIESEPTSLLENAKNDATNELSNELANRMNEKSFFSSPPDRKKSEFKISKALVVVALDHLVANL